ncbi:DMT family transporter [Actinomadura litoris]|uniref:EamA family transporter n=1 Tax=Actinomadura litoris TaxID=2678616 RepID=A0A7K1L433_9ACTN|nr:DMT family transporter [Actinomadura litoris]MUN39194.1 EamA family transporter [Actinomadura litoris]
MTVALAVILAGVLHAIWNAIAKGAADRWATFALIGLGQAIAVAPLLALGLIPDRGAWPWLATSVAVHIVYMGLLLKSYELGDFGQVYPLARGSAPLVVALVAAFGLGERPSPAQAAGIAAVCGGLAVLAFAGRAAETPHDPRAVAAALLTGAAIASYTLVDGVGVRAAGGVLPYTAWLFGLQGPVTVAAVIAVRGTRTITRLDRRQWLTGLAGALIAVTAYGIVLWAQTRGALASVAALRETGVVSGAVIGAVFFSERLGPRRIAAACVVATGAVLITVH